MMVLITNDLNLLIGVSLVENLGFPKHKQRSPLMMVPEMREYSTVMRVNFFGGSVQFP